MDATASLARFTHDLRAGDLPAGAIDASARLALDTVGAAMPAWDAPGVRELRSLLEGRNGFFAVYEGGDYDAEALTAGLGDRFEIERLGFKRYPICGMAHPAVDALRELQAEHGFAEADVESIVVYGSKFVVDMVGRPYRPGDSPDVDAQFSLPYCLATVLRTGNMRLADLRPEHTLDAERRALADRIPVVLDDNLHGKWTARVAVRVRDDRAFERTRDKAAGQSDAPLSEDDLLAKFEDSAAAAGPMLDTDAARRLADLLLDLPRLPHLMPLCDALAPGRIAAHAS